MSEPSNCRCVVCAVEETLRDELETETEVRRFRELCSSASELRSYPAPLALIAHIHGLRHSNGSGQHSDRILAALRTVSQRVREETPQSILLLAFVPLLHATVGAVACRFPSLPRSDITQQAFTFLIALLQSPEWLSRKSHLAFGLARELRRAVFVWARGEVRFTSEANHRSKQEGAISPAELFEHDVTLKHFLYRSLQVGALDSDDLDLLIQFKLEGDFGNGAGEPASNAVRQKMKRLLSKMRRRAAYRIPKKRQTAVSERNSDTFSDFFPE